MIIGSKVYEFDQSSNSMHLAKQYLQEAPDGAVFLVKELKEAHGRQDRIWSVYPGQISVTFLLKPKILSQISSDDLSLRLNQLNMAITLGIMQALEPYGVKLKWPNDFMLNDKKMGGMIMELSWAESDLQGIVVGFSINVNNIFDKSDELYNIVTSLKQELNKDFDRKLLCESLLISIDEYYQKWLDGAFDEIYGLWQNRQDYKGKNISVHQKDGKLIRGEFGDVLSNGDLVLKETEEKEVIISFYQVEQINES